MTQERRSVAGVARDGNLFLVALRKAGKNLGSYWEFPGGKLEPGERPEEALVREFREELEVEVEAGEPISESQFTLGSDTFQLLAFFVHLRGEIGRLEEHVRVDWLPLREIDHLCLVPSDRPVLDALHRMEREDPDRPNQ